ncbi:hypothetical protein M413DRAFT_255581 [Hebeloma cylindrosporum]|uniref:Uncharacterized protein n=1 Tax=Hebeloma cylindrosporum TaxID=76867 RepID=A0A0C3C2D8_HEBCY|nr:hypothetical protein M413DRAFT_255581 [Hebeloma cylindrosporum h7]
MESNPKRYCQKPHPPEQLRTHPSKLLKVYYRNHSSQYYEYNLLSKSERKKKCRVWRVGCWGVGGVGGLGCRCVRRSEKRKKYSNKQDHGRAIERREEGDRSWTECGHEKRHNDGYEDTTMRGRGKKRHGILRRGGRRRRKRGRKT